MLKLDDHDNLLPMKTILLVLGLMLGSLAAVGQTLKETTDWMHSFTGANSSWSVTGTDGILTSILTFKGCQATQTMYENGKPKEPSIKFSLSDLDPMSVKAYTGNVDNPKPFPHVGFETTNSKSKIDFGGFSGLDTWQQNFVDYADATRFAKALRHAIVLCGGKPSTF